MIKYDTHMHTNYSTDSNTPLFLQIQKAEQLGLQGICITDHMDYDFPPEELEHPVDDIPFWFDLEQYQKELNEISCDIKLLKGVECGLQTTHSVINQNTNLICEYDWDYVIGSLHLVEKKDPYYSSFWNNKDPKECITKYFSALLENIQQFHKFDSLGHMDYIVRYAPSSYEYHPEDFMDILDEILKLIIRKDVALEINTSGWKTQGRCQNPHLDILKHYVQLGGELITIGSDAHTPEYVAYDFEQVPALIKKAGLHQYCVYQKRKPVFMDLN